MISNVLNVYRNIVLVIMVLVLSCDEVTEPKVIEGCTIDSACNYNEEATDNDGSCIAPKGCNEWCEGYAGTPQQLDCNQYCGEIGDGQSLLGTGVFECLNSEYQSEETCINVGNTTWGQIGNDECVQCGGPGINSNDCCPSGLGLNGEEPDCAGVCGGVAIVDVCGVCDGGIEEEENCGECGSIELVDECFYEIDGEYFINEDQWCTCELQCDRCGVCGGDDMVELDVYNNVLDGICDCNNEVEGTAYVDACLTCVGGNTGVDECECTEEDIDECGICEGQGINSKDCCPNGLGINGEEPDCDGICGGDAFLDDCNKCSDGASNHTENSDKDCYGDCFGEAYYDDCGICVGGNTGLAACNACNLWYMDYFTCDTDLDVEIDDKCCKENDSNDKTKCEIQDIDNCNLHQCNIDYDNYIEEEPFCYPWEGYTSDSLSTICANGFIDECLLGCQNSGFITYDEFVSCGDGTSDCCEEPECDESVTLSLEYINEITLRVNYSSTVAIGGFQFDLVGATSTNGITGSGGAAAANNLAVLGSGGATVLSYGAAGGSIPAGSGILTDLTVVISNTAEKICFGFDSVIISSPAPVNNIDSCPIYWQLTCIDNPLY